jgi:hypothetical protein
MCRCHSGNGLSGLLVAHRPLMNRKSRRDICENRSRPLSRK